VSARKIGSKTGQKGAVRASALGLVVAGGTVLPIVIGAALAQSGDGDRPAGPRLTFSFDSQITASDNPGFDLNPAEGGIWATGNLEFGISDETPLSSFELNADFALRAGLAGDVEDGVDLPKRGLRLGYSRDGLDSAFEVKARLTESKIDFLRPLADFTDENGDIVLPDDLDELIGSGWRRQLGFDTTLTLGRNAPFGAVLGVGASELSYRDASNPALDDSRRAYADVGLRFDLSAVTRLDVGLRYSIYEDSDQQDETWTLRSNLTFDRPDGNLRFGLTATETEDGTRISADVGRLIERPWGSIDARLGVIGTGDGGTTLGGGLKLNYDLPDARLTARLDRSLASGKDNDETLRTALALGYRKAINQRSALSLDIGYVEIDNRVTGLGTDLASLSLGYGYELTRDWTLNLGYAYRVRDEEGIGRTQENAVTLTLRRGFEIGF
jgi:hypothetical protein